MSIPDPFTGADDPSSYTRLPGHAQAQALEDMAAAALKDPNTGVSQGIGRSTRQRDVCPYCTSSFDSVGALNMHVMSAHGKVSSNQSRLQGAIDDLLNRSPNQDRPKYPPNITVILYPGDTFALNERYWFQNLTEDKITVHTSGDTDSVAVRMARAGLTKVAGPPLPGVEYMDPSDQAIRAWKRGRIDFERNTISLRGAVQWTGDDFGPESEYGCGRTDGGAQHDNLEEFVRCACGFHAVADREVAEELGGNCTLEVELAGWVVEGDYNHVYNHDGDVVTAYRGTKQKILAVTLDLEGACSAWLCRDNAVGLLRDASARDGIRPLCASHLAVAPVLDRGSLADLKAFLGFEVRFSAC